MNKKSYSLEQSPFYRMRNRRTLAKLLGLEENYFRHQHEYIYNEFSKLKSDGKGERQFAVPSQELRQIQKKNK